MSTRARKWGHQATHEVWKKRLRVNCSCGVHSPVFVDMDERTKEEQAEDWWVNTHTKLVEQQRRME